MRIIKFRAWHTGNEAMVYGGFSIHATAGKIISEFYCEEHLSAMQFTGLTDCKGKDIYEGDVIYLAGYGDYLVEFPFLELYDSGAENDIGKIIGNIHENPELLKDDS